ncbi:MAG: hypothetical protein IPN67_01750 [Bacteroidales bacterium]|nr:hypothetical protein [Bacteroidales bacterium]
MKKRINRKVVLTGSSIILALITLSFIGALTACKQAGNSTFTVDISQKGPEVAPICRGQQIEEFNYQIQGGFYAQLINNPSFEELKNPISFWTIVKSASSNGNLVSQTSVKRVC